MQILSEDFKYIMQDTMKVYLGASYSYDELMKDEHTPFKLKAIIQQYMRKDVAGDITLAQHVMQLKEESLSYMAYHQLKVKIKVTLLGSKQGKKGQKENECKLMPLDAFMEYMKTYPADGDFFIEEVCVSKLSLMGFSI